MQRLFSLAVMNWNDPPKTEITVLWSKSRLRGRFPNYPDLGLFCFFLLVLLLDITAVISILDRERQSNLWVTCCSMNIWFLQSIAT